MPVASGSKWWMSRHHKKTEVTWKEVNKLRILACNKTLQSLASCQHMASFGDYLQARAVRYSRNAVRLHAALCSKLLQGAQPAVVTSEELVSSTW